MGRVRHWAKAAIFGWGIASFCGRTSATPVVAADILWQGPCEDRAALDRHLLERGVLFVATTNPGDVSSALRLSVTVTREPSLTETETLHAVLALSDMSGGHETRVVEADRCSTLQSVLAVILASLAHHRQSRVAGLAQAPQHDPRAQLDDAPVPIPPPQTHSSVGPQSPGHVQLNAVKFELRGKARPDQSAHHGELQFGSNAVTGLGWADSSSRGAALHLEWRPTLDWPIAMGIMVAHVPNLGREGRGTDVALARRWGRLMAIVDTPIPHVRMTLGAELGEVVASTPDAADHGSDRAAWYAGTAMPRADIPLFSRLLFLQIAAGAGYMPVRYAMKYVDTQQVFSSTRSLEWRAELGLAVRVFRSFP